MPFLPYISESLRMVQADIEAVSDIISKMQAELSVGYAGFHRYPEGA